MPRREKKYEVGPHWLRPYTRPRAPWVAKWSAGSYSLLAKLLCLWAGFLSMVANSKTGMSSGLLAASESCMFDMLLNGDNSLSFYEVF